MWSTQDDPVRYEIVYPSGSTSRQLYLDDVFTHIKLCRMAGREMPTMVRDLRLPDA